MIAGPGGDMALRVYTPLGAGEVESTIVYFHGGGWVMGDLESHDAVCRALSNAAASVVVSVDYRLAPEHRFPAAIDDAYAATCWVAENAVALGAGDPNRLVVAGDSAGGNLAAAVALESRDLAGPQLSFQALVYPVLDARFDTPSYVDNATGYMLTRADMEWFWDHYCDAAARLQPYASPLQANSLERLPPALVLTAEFDPLRDEGEAYAARLIEAGVSATVHRYPGMLHGFLGMLGIFTQSRDAIAEIGTAIRTAPALTASRR
jgi:acetyl esterase